MSVLLAKNNWTNTVGCVSVSCTTVEHLPHYPKDGGLSPVAFSVPRGEMTDIAINFVSLCSNKMSVLFVKNN
jgi:hypothetical protein